MTVIEEIIRSKGKPKEIVILLAEKIKGNKKLIIQLIEYFENGSTVEKGICMEALEYVTKDNSEFALPYIDFIIAHVNDEAPRIKWETARAIGNIAQKFSDKVSEAVPKLLLNTKDSGTVVRWSAAYALSEIAKHNTKIRNALIPQINDIIKKEANSGVKNVYLKALKIINK